jgi:hypothetical protein
MSHPLHSAAPESGSAMDNDEYALEQLKLQETYWMERGRDEKLSKVREQIANVEARIADRLPSLKPHR